MNKKENELKDICNKAFKRNSVYPLMEIPEPEVKGTIEEILNSVYIKSENAKREMQAERNAYNRILLNSLSILVPIKLYDMIIIKSVL